MTQPSGSSEPAQMREALHYVSDLLTADLATRGDQTQTAVLTRFNERSVQQQNSRLGGHYLSTDPSQHTPRDVREIERHVGYILQDRNRAGFPAIQSIIERTTPSDAAYQLMRVDRERDPTLRMQRPSSRRTDAERGMVPNNPALWTPEEKERVRSQAFDLMERQDSRHREQLLRHFPTLVAAVNVPRSPEPQPAQPAAPVYQQGYQPESSQAPWQQPLTDRTRVPETAWSSAQGDYVNISGPAVAAATIAAQPQYAVPSGYESRPAVVVSPNDFQYVDQPAANNPSPERGRQAKSGEGLVRRESRVRRGDRQRPGRERRGRSSRRDRSDSNSPPKGARAKSQAPVNPFDVAMAMVKSVARGEPQDKGGPPAPKSLKEKLAHIALGIGHTLQASDGDLGTVGKIAALYGSYKYGEERSRQAKEALEKLDPAQREQVAEAMRKLSKSKARSNVAVAEAFETALQNTRFSGLTRITDTYQDEQAVQSGLESLRYDYQRLSAAVSTSPPRQASPGPVQYYPQPQQVYYAGQQQSQLPAPRASSPLPWQPESRRDNERPAAQQRPAAAAARSSRTAYVEDNSDNEHRRGSRRDRDRSRRDRDPHGSSYKGKGVDRSQGRGGGGGPSGPGGM
jgi:hypothetical protein